MGNDSLNFQDPNPCNLSREEIYSLGEEIAEFLKFNPGDNIEDIVKSLGGSIKYVDDWEYFDNETIIVEDKNKFTIFISNYTSPLRDRFTIAHELGHYFLHSESGEKPIKVKRSGSSRLETEANWFAAGFLMPEEAFRREYEKYKSPIVLSRIFRVSEQAIRVRIDYLKL